MNIVDLHDNFFCIERGQFNLANTTDNTADNKLSTQIFVNVKGVLPFGFQYQMLIFIFKKYNRVSISNIL